MASGDFTRLPQRQRLDAVQVVIRDKMAAAANAQDLTRRVTRLLNFPRRGVTPSVLKRGLATGFGLTLSDDDVQALFDRYDKEGLGCISVQKFIKRCQPKDFSQPLWNVARDKADEATAKARHGTYRPTLDALPPSLARVKWDTGKVLRKLQQKLEQRAKHPGLSLSAEAFAMFGAPADGVTPAAFMESMRRMGFVCDDTELMEVFKVLDFDGSGVITLADLVKGVLSKDESAGPTWAGDLVRGAGKAAMQERVPTTVPAALAATRKERGLPFVEDQLREKVAAKTATGPGAFREVFRLFGHNSRSISLSTFIASCRRLGIVATDKDFTRLFQKYDRDGAGKLEFSEFAAMVTPSDFPETPWQVKRDAELAELNHRKRVEGYEPVPDALPPSLAKVPKMTIPEVEAAIVQRVDQRARGRATALYREAYRLFGSPHDGITPAMLKRQLARMGLLLSEEDLDRMFELYDTDKNGRISFEELADRLFNQGETTKQLWVMTRDGEMMKRKKEMRELLRRDAPHLVPKFRPPAGREPALTGRTSELSTGRSSYLSTGRSFPRSTGRSSTVRSGASTSSLRSAGHRSVTSSRSHSAVRLGPDLGLVGSATGFTGRLGASAGAGAALPRA